MLMATQQRLTRLDAQCYQFQLNEANEKKAFDIKGQQKLDCWRIR